MINIRSATLADAVGINRINAEELHYDIPLEATERQLVLIFSQPWHNLFVAEVDGIFAGYVQADDYVSTYGERAVNIMGLPYRSSREVVLEGHL